MVLLLTLAGLHKFLLSASIFAKFILPAQLFFLRLAEREEVSFPARAKTQMPMPEAPYQRPGIAVVASAQRALRTVVFLFHYSLSISVNRLNVNPSRVTFSKNIFSGRTQ